MATEETVYERWTKWLMDALASKKFVEDESAIHMALTGIVAEAGQLPHGEKDCVLWYDGCHCTLEALVHNIKRADSLQREVDRLNTVIVAMKAAHADQAAWATTAWTCDTCDLLARCAIFADLNAGSQRSAKDLAGFGCRYWKPKSTQS